MSRRPLRVSLFLCILIGGAASEADEPELRPTRFIMGFYANSITELATRRDIEVSLNFWAKDILQEQASKKMLQVTEAKAVLFDNMQEMRAAAKRGEVDLIVAPPLMIVRNFNRDELEDGFTGMLQDGKPDDILLVARKDKHLNSVSDLRGKHFVMPDNDEMVEAFIDDLFLQKLKLGYRKALATVDIEKKASRIMLDIYFNKADAGIVYRNAYEVVTELNPDVMDKIAIIDSHPTKSRNFSYFVNHYPYSKELQEIMTTAGNQSARGKQILEVFKTQTIVPCKVEELNAYAEFETKYQNLKHRLKQ